MIHLKEFPSATFDTKKEAFKALVENKDELIRLKKLNIKLADGFNFGAIQNKTTAEKSSESNADEITVKVVVNTTNILDSHGDVHLPGIWKRTLSHSDIKLHLQEHKREFDKVIDDRAKAYTKRMSWKDLNLNYDGETEALIFESVIKKNRNPMMFNQYKNGWVNNHSVGMSYVEIGMAINSDENWAREYKDVWEEYFPQVANQENAEKSGFFWIVKEAKLFEGSAVLFGSNPVTPTLHTSLKSASAPSEKTLAKQKQFFINLI